MSELRLTGLDGKNPVAFLAALGALNVLADRANASCPEPKLVWVAEGTYRPAILDGPDRTALLDLLMNDVASFRSEPALDLRYQKGGDGSAAHDLKPPPAVFANYLRTLLGLPDPRRSLAFAAAFATDVAEDNNGNVKPTALHFTAGQQEFLAMVNVLVDGVTPADMEEALFGPWRYERGLPVLQWDNASSREYALRATDPSKDKKLGVPGADWLAFRGLPFIPVAPIGDRVATAGCRGEWKTGSFRWPLWSKPLPRSVIRSLLTSREMFEVDPRTLRERGIDIVLESLIRRSDQGGYGNFAPARIAAPATDLFG